MADLDDIKEGKNFGLDRPQQNTLYTLKGCGSLEWGMQSRLARIFNPQSNRTVMLAFDHGYFQGPTTGLERIDLYCAVVRRDRRADVHRGRAAQSGAGGDQQTGGAARFRRQLDP